MQFSELPDVMTPKHLIDFLPLGKNTIYEALQSQRIRNIRVGQKILIPKPALRDFLEGVENHETAGTPS